MSFIESSSPGVLRHVLIFGIMALSRVCDESAPHTFLPKTLGQRQQEDQEEQETSMHNLLEAILEREPFPGLVYY